MLSSLPDFRLLHSGHQSFGWATILALVVVPFVSLSLWTAMPCKAQDRWGSDIVRNRDQFGFDDMWQGSGWLSTLDSNTNRWNLGISGENTPVGVRVRSVDRNSAAARARIEPNDIVVNVEGYQVGTIHGRTYDLGTELNRRASSTGVVHLLLQDHLSGRLDTVRIQLDSNETKLTGTLVYRNARSLPSDAMVTVEIQNATRPHYALHNGQTTFSLRDVDVRSGEIPFELAYDPNFINAEDTYRVRAHVAARGRTLLFTPRPADVITAGNRSQVRLELVSVDNQTASNGRPDVVTAGYPNYNVIDDRIIQLYRRYLGRSPSTLELAALRQTPGIASRLDNLSLELMAAQEYFDLVGNNNSEWFRRVFQNILGRQPSGREFEQWMQRYADLRYSRTELLRQLDSQARRQ